MYFLLLCSFTRVFLKLCFYSITLTSILIFDILWLIDLSLLSVAHWKKFLNDFISH
ncbi:hypothetical protein LPICM17_500068 [Lactococcus piscium]|nr:hypothetical protein LPICM17_500068 [Lactococcus piscium]